MAMGGQLAMGGQASRVGGQGFAQNLTTVFCYHCQTIGHSTSFCPMPKPFTLAPHIPIWFQQPSLCTLSLSPPRLLHDTQLRPDFLLHLPLGAIPSWSPLKIGLNCKDLAGHLCLVVAMVWLFPIKNNFPLPTRL